MTLSHSSLDFFALFFFMTNIYAAGGAMRYLCRTYRRLERAPSAPEPAGLVIPSYSGRGVKLSVENVLIAFSCVYPRRSAFWRTADLVSGITAP